MIAQKSSEEESGIAEAIKKNTNLASVVTLDDAKVKSLAQAALMQSIARGTTVITQGSAEADFFYVIKDGQFEVFVGNDSKCVSVLHAGDSFGELALLYFAPRAATVVAAKDSTVWMIDRATFKEVLLQESKEKIKEYSTTLSKVSMLSPLLEEERMKLASALTEVLFDKNHEIVRQGDQGNTFYILIDGAVEVTIDGKTVHRMTASIADGKTESFGEKALLENNVRAATVIVTSPEARALAVDRDTFTALLGSLEDIQKGLHGKGMASKENAATRRKIARTDLDPIGLLGCGGFGAVELVEHIETRETFALKKLSKGHIVAQGMQQSVINEKSIMFMSNSDFIVKLYATFNTSQSLCFLMEVALGGELYATYNVRALWGSESHAKYYLAGVALAFEHLHERFVLYRDLKPENVLLNSEGRPKLTDMGLAKFAIEKTYTTCGTPDYFAPEVISTTGQTCAVDWWTLGIMTFELMCGRPPFEAPTPLQTYAKVLKGISKVSFPPRCQGAVADLVRATLKKDPADRLPMRPGKTRNVKQHKWYSGFSWDDFATCAMEPPYKPEVKSASDIANFSASKEDMPPQIHYSDDGSGWDADFAS
jgi:cGMP-dependent protein kinase